MAEHFLYLTTIGRTTGLLRQIEIWFVEHGGRVYMVSEAREGSHWVKNLMKHPEVSFSIGTRTSRGSVRPQAAAQAHVVRPDEEPALCAAVSALMDAKYGWSDGLIVELTPS